MRKPDTAKKGWFGSSSKSWKYWYLVLHGKNLHYYARKGDTTSKKSFALLPGCTISGPVAVHSYLWTFEISFPDDYTHSGLSSVASSSLLEDASEHNNSQRADRAVVLHKGMHRRRPSGDLSTVVFDVPGGEATRRRKGSSSESKGEHVTKKVRKQQKSIKKNTQKLAAAENKAPTKRALRRTKAEFGCPNAKLARLWVDAIRYAIQQNGGPRTLSSSDLSITTQPMRGGRDNDPSRLRRASMGTVPQNDHGNFPLVEDLPLSPTARSSFFSALTSTRFSALKGHSGEPDDDDDDDPHDIAYAVHRVHGNMIVHKEISPDDTPTVMEIHEKATEYNETIYMAVIVGVTAGILLNWYGFGVTIQVLLGFALALIPMAMRVINSEKSPDQLVPTYMTTQLVRGSPDSVFNAIVVDDFRHFWDVASSSIAVLENRDPHCDIVHVILKPVWITSMGIWAKTRELVLLRYWRREPDGSYYIVNQSTEHPDAPKKRSVLPGSHAVCGLDHRAAAARPARGPGDVECHLHAQVRRRRHRTLAQQTRWIRLHFLAAVPQLGCRTGGLPQDPRLRAAAGRFCGRGGGHGFAGAPDQPQPAARRSRHNR